jgi:leader peptidase (prepilin peptidase) / N-methyltransferase
VRAVLLALAAAGVGGFLVGPQLALATKRWIGWRVIVPQLTGFVAARGDLPRVPRREVAPARWSTAIAVVTAVAFGLAALRIGWSAGLLPVLVLTAGMVAVSIVDLQCWRIPTRFVYLTAAGVVVALGAEAVSDGEPGILTGAAVGFAVYLVVLGTMHLASRRMMGFGDVRLGALIGLVVGSAGWQEAQLLTGALSWSLFGLMLSSLVGTVAGAVTLVARRRARSGSRSGPSIWREPFPYGPWLCLGAYIALLLAAP